MSSLLQQGLNVTAIGMGVVFVLLTLLVYIIRGMSALSRTIEDRLGASAPEGREEETPLSPHELVSVIGAAIAAYRRRH